MKACCRAREMMHGLRDSFDYVECTSCGCVQIADWPEDLQKYYPSHYYSFQRPNPLARLSREVRLLSEASGLSRAVASLFGRSSRRLPADFVPADLARSTRILDIGSGSGAYVDALFCAGFQSVHGIDPNMAPASERNFPFKLERTVASTLVARGERYGFVYMSHSLEHMQDQHAALGSVRKLLEVDGLCCIRIPWVSSEAWERYGANWVQLDAPRHFYLHSRRSFEHLISSAGFRIVKLWCDSTAFQFWASEQYAKDIPLYSERSWLVAPARSIFTKAQLADYERRAGELNQAGRGDQIVAWLAPTGG